MSKEVLKETFGRPWAWRERVVINSIKWIPVSPNSHLRRWKKRKRERWSWAITDQAGTRHKENEKGTNRRHCEKERTQITDLCHLKDVWSFSNPTMRTTYHHAYQYHLHCYSQYGSMNPRCESNWRVMEHGGNYEIWPKSRVKVIFYFHVRVCPSVHPSVLGPSVRCAVFFLELIRKMVWKVEFNNITIKIIQ